MFPPNVFFIKIEKALSFALPDVSLLFIVIIDVGFACKCLSTVNC